MRLKSPYRHILFLTLFTHNFLLRLYRFMLNLMIQFSFSEVSFINIGHLFQYFNTIILKCLYYKTTIKRNFGLLNNLLQMRIPSFFYRILCEPNIIYTPIMLMNKGVDISNSTAFRLFILTNLFNCFAKFYRELFCLFRVFPHQ